MCHADTQLSRRLVTIEACSLIRDEGVVKPWPRDGAKPRYHHHSLELDGWQYWTMDDVLADTELINRARVDDPTSAWRGGLLAEDQPLRWHTSLEQRDEQLRQLHGREPFSTRLQLVWRPPSVFPDDAGLLGVEAAGVDDMLADSDEEEALEVTLVDVLPAKDVVARPDRRRQRSGVDDQPDLLCQLAGDCRLV